MALCRAARLPSMKFTLETPHDLQRAVKQAIKYTDLMLENSYNATCPSNATSDLEDARNHLSLSEMLLQQAFLKWKGTPRQQKARAATIGK
jgi:hypothetical protein